MSLLTSSLLWSQVKAVETQDCFSSAKLNILALLEAASEKNCDSSMDYFKEETGKKNS